MISLSLGQLCVTPAASPLAVSFSLFPSTLPLASVPIRPPPPPPSLSPFSDPNLLPILINFPRILMTMMKTMANLMPLGVLLTGYSHPTPSRCVITPLERETNLYTSSYSWEISYQNLASLPLLFRKRNQNLYTVLVQFEGRKVSKFARGCLYTSVLTLVQTDMIRHVFQESEWLRVTLHKWLDDEYCPELTNVEISKVAAQSYYKSLLEKRTDPGEILLKMARELESISYQESFHGAFSSANAAIHLMAQRIEDSCQST